MFGTTSHNPSTKSEPNNHPQPALYLHPSLQALSHQYRGQTSHTGEAKAVVYPTDQNHLPSRSAMSEHVLLKPEKSVARVTATSDTGTDTLFDNTSAEEDAFISLLNISIVFGSTEILKRHQPI